jgi:hypothetical protein
VKSWATVLDTTPDPQRSDSAAPADKRNPPPLAVLAFAGEP